MMIFSIIAVFLRSQFTEKLICDLIFEQIFELFPLIEGYFKTIKMICNMCL